MAGDERLDEIGVKHGVDLAIREHRFDRFLLWQQSKIDIWRQRYVDVIVNFGNPLDAIEGHSVFVLKDAAHPQYGCRHQSFDTDLSALQVDGFGDAAFGIDEYEAMSKAAVREYGDGANRPIVVASGKVGGSRQLRDIELSIVKKSPVAGRRIHLG
jgi:hypothetical protein